MKTLGWRILLRSFLVQGSWSFQRLQGPGFFLMTWPALRRREADAGPPALARAGSRNLALFNTHPYFAGLVAAVVLHEEADGAAPEAVEGIKRSLMCALGALGDELFWAWLRPLAALAALPPALAGRAWAPLLLLALYNAPHVGLRAWGVGAGLARGRGVLGALQGRALAKAVPALAGATLALAGFAVGWFAGHAPWGLLPGRAVASAAAGAGLFAFFLASLRVGLRPEQLLGGLVLVAAGAGAARVVLSP